MKKIVILMVVIMLGCFSVSSVWADVIYVNGSADGANTGVRWMDAYTDIQLALGAAVSGDEIWVAAGTYKPTTGTDRAISFFMRDGVSLYGGFAGGETLLEQRDWEANETILSGDIGVQDDNSDNSYHVLRGADNATLDGFVITMGHSNGGSSDNSGGGMLNYQCSPTISNCIFRDNIGGGGGENGGGGIWNRGDPVITNCIFLNNHTNGEGGGINNSGGNPIIMNCSFIRNTSNYNSGGMHNRQCIPLVENCIFNGNKAGNIGGAIYNYESRQTFVNCLFTGNTATYGGGVFNRRGGPSEFINTTFSYNTADYNGGGMYCESHPTNLSNCILWGNSGINGSQIYNYNSSISVSYSDIQGGWEGDGNIDADPSFVRNPDDGGDGWGVGDNDDYGDLRLQSDSPCIDAGAEVSLTTDIEGNARPFDFPYLDNNGELLDFDMGAYECVTIPDYAITVLSPKGGEK